MTKEYTLKHYKTRIDVILYKRKKASKEEAYHGLGVVCFFAYGEK